MQPCFTPAKQVKASVNLLSTLTADLSFEYMDIKTSRKRPCTPSFLGLLRNSFCRGIQSKAFLKSTKHEKSKFWCFCGLDSVAQKFTAYSSSEVGVVFECDGDDCSIEWFHLRCVGLRRTLTAEK